MVGEAMNSAAVDRFIILRKSMVLVKGKAGSKKERKANSLCIPELPFLLSPVAIDWKCGIGKQTCKQLAIIAPFCFLLCRALLFSGWSVEHLLDTSRSPETNN